MILKRRFFILTLIIAITVFLSTAEAVHVRVVIVRGYTSGSINWSYIAQFSYQKCAAMIEEVDGIDIILFPEFAFGGTDGGSHYRPEVTFTYDPELGYVPHPLNPSAPEDVRTAAYIDSLRYIALSETCYVWASTCGEVIEGINYNSLPIFWPDGKLHRIRRKCLYSSLDETRDTTIHCDSVAVKSGGAISVMTTICYENAALDGLLDPVDAPAPLWLLPHGTWSAAGNPNMTYRTQKWTWNPEGISLSGVWDIPRDGWVRVDATLLSCDIFSTNWTAMGIDNYGNDRDPVAYEPLAWVEERPTYVIVDLHVPQIGDSIPVRFASSRQDKPAFEKLTALPEISSGPVFIFGAAGEIEIYDENNRLVERLAPEPEHTIWEGIIGDKNPPGDYVIKSGAEEVEVKLIH
ncbi:hypothetical protein JXI42_10930 [bacterium]|nr:hypothetical protein [bacterium]